MSTIVPTGQSSLRFDWDPDKARLNRHQHGITFEEAQTTFDDPHARIIDDPDHSELEARAILLGYTQRNRLLVVVFAERRDTIRLISARKATRKERKTYEEKIRRETN